MLELEKKFETRLDELQLDVRRDIAKMTDERQLRTELAALVEDKLLEAFDPRSHPNNPHGKL